MKSIVLTLVISVALAVDVSAQCLNANFSPGQPFKTTGDLALDAKFNAEGNLLYQVFRVNPNMFIFDDSGSPNAFASPALTLPGYSGTVFFGVGLLRDELWSMDKGEHAVAGIMAHEFAHVLQMKRHCTLPGKLRELHADYMAGYYLAKKSSLYPTDIEAFATSLFQKGDYAFWSPLHHGTPEQRVAAMQKGFGDGDSTLSEAYQNGIAFVQHLDEGGSADDSE
jgi:hypothetical protein